MGGKGKRAVAFAFILLVAITTSKGSDVVPSDWNNRGTGPLGTYQSMAFDSYRGVTDNSSAVSTDPYICSLRDGTGELSLVWISNQTGTDAVYFNRYDTAGNRLLATDIMISGGASPASLPSCGVDSSGNTHVVWKENGSLMYSKADPLGAILVTPFVRVPGPIDYPDVDAEAGGPVHVVWVSTSAPRQVKYRKLDSTGGLIDSCPEVTLGTSQPPLSTEYPFALAPGSGNNYPFMSWHGNDVQSTDYMNVSYTYPSCGNPYGPFQQTNDLVVGRSAMVPLFTVANSAYLVFEGTRSGSTQHVYWLRTAGDYFALDQGSGPAGEPALASLNRQDVFAVWEDSRTGTPQIYSQTMNGLTSSPVGDNCLVSTPGAPAHKPSVARAGANAFAIAWEDGQEVRVAIRGLSCPPCVSNADCNDNNPCTDDSCDPARGCVHTPTQEICNGIDDDCDGTVDNGFDVGASCTVGVGACQRTGSKVCTSDGLATQCGVVPGNPTPETCTTGWTTTATARWTTASVRQPAVLVPVSGP